MLAAVSENGLALQFASTTCKNDKKIVLAAARGLKLTGDVKHDSVELLNDDMFWTNLNDEIAEILRAHNKAKQKCSSNMMQVIDNIVGPVNSNS